MTNIDPFGRASCEQEIKVLGQKQYVDLFFYETPFNEAALTDEVYLIVGRRGSGKSALAQYFSFQKLLPEACCIEVRRPEAYQQVLSEISRRTSESRVFAVAHLIRVWELVIWSLVSNMLEQHPLAISLPLAHDAPPRSMSQVVSDIFNQLLEFFDERTGRTMGSEIERFIDRVELDAIKKNAIRMASQRPIIISIDTLEQYDTSNEALMNALAALIEYAAEFNLEYSSMQIHLKVFVSGEVFPHLKEAVLLNPSKAIRHPVFLLWRPRDLLRLTCWRFRWNLINHGLWTESAAQVNWEDDDDVLNKVWIPHFGKSLTNARGNIEDTWPYVLRHTQMRPRQLILACNAIAKRALDERTYPIFSEHQIIDGIKEAEVELASEIVNSFKEIYPNVDRIISALSRLPKVFSGRELDKRARQSAPEWPDSYSPTLFRQLVTELGIIGRVTRGDSSTEYIDADFEYASTDRLMLTHRDTCVVHPMFYRKLAIDFNSEARVIPFTTSRGSHA